MDTHSSFDHQFNNEQPNEAVSNQTHLSNATEQIQVSNDQMYKNRVISGKVNSELILPRRQEVNVTTEDDVKVGFTQEEHRIIDRLIGGEVGLDIVAIVGMAGQGKTTLAQRVFRNSRVQRHFYKYAWCCISQAYDIKLTLQVILKDVSESVSQEQFEYLSQEDLADQLRKCLKGRRYLLVLDDMWDAKAWYELKLSFPDDNNGSRILMTSRNRNVAFGAKTDCCIVELHSLSDEESWNLLLMKVFGEDFCPSTLSDIGNTIAKNCKGLPLAIVVVAGLLKKDKNLDSWKQISESLKSQIASEGCMNILDLSYKLLPDYLKPCFLYLGAFPEDEIIDVKMLIQLWIAEGFVKNDGLKSLRVVANEYLIDLVARSLVLVTRKSSRNGIKKCRVHDLLRELCLIRAEEERFMWSPNVSNNPSGIRCDHYHRLCVNRNWDPFAESKPNFLRVQSLLFSGGRLFYSRFRFEASFWKRFKLLKVLNLSCVDISETEFYEITQCIHLRLLSIVCSFSIPSSIVNLSKLEVIRVQFGGVRRYRNSDFFRMFFFPSTMMEMANLRLVYVNTVRFGYSKYFDEMQLRMSPPFTNFETLGSLEFEERSSFESLAQKLPCLLKLGLKLQFCVPLSSYFKKLESLNLYIRRQGPSGSEVISPFTLDFPLNLKKLNFSTRRRLSRTMILSIGKLCSLEVLKLRAYFEDERWDVEDDEFLKLKYLEFKSPSIQEWNISEDSFPRLEQLVINGCRELGELPSRFGAIPTLKRIEVHECSHSVSNSFQQIVDDQIESGNEDLQLSISYTDNTYF